MLLHDVPAPGSAPEFLTGGGEMGALMRAQNWSASPLGSPETWPPSLRTAVSICLGASTPIGVYWGEQLALLYNDAFARLIGSKHPRALGCPAQEVFPEIWPTIEPMFAGVYATGTAASSSEQLLPLEVNGQLENRWFDFSFNPIRGSDGRVDGVFNIAVESTGRVRATGDLQAVAGRTGEILESISDAFYAVDANWRFTYVNRKAEAWWGRSRASLLGKTYWDEFPQAVGSEPYKAHLRAAETREVVRLEAMSPILGHWVDISIYPSADGGLSVYFRDITNKKAAEGRLRASEARLSAIFESATVGLSEASLDGRFLEVNDELCRILGRKRADLLTIGIADVTHPEDLPPSLDAVAQAVTTGETSSLDKRYLRPDGGMIWANSRVTRLRSADGRPGNLLVVTVDLTERRAAEERVRASEEFKRGILASSADCIKVLDLEARLEFMSDGAMCVLEVDDFGAVRGACWPDFWQGKERMKAQAAVEEAKRGGTGRFQGFATTMKGSPRWWDVIVTPINGPDGRPEKLLSVSRDVTATREAEERLRESETRLRHERARLETLVDNLPVGVCFVGQDGVAVQSNPAFRRFLPDDPMPSRMAEGADRWRAWDEHGQRLPRDRYPGARALRGDASEAEFLHRSENGEERWTRVAGVPIRDGRDQVVAGLVVIVDIDEQKRAQELLERRVADALAERKVFADVVEGATSAIMAIDLEYNILAVNRANIEAIERVYGQRPKVGDNLLELLSDMPEHQAQVRDTWARALRGEEFAVIDTFGDEDHDRVAFEVRFSVLRDRDGRQIGATHTAYDVTERVRAQAELEQAQEALRQSQKLESMGQLTGGVAHDFNNLLTPIVGSLDLLQRKRLGGEREKRMIEGALQSAERAKTLVQRLLAFARRQPLQATAVDVGALVSGMADLVASTSGPQIKVVVDLADELPAAVVDQNQLEMALLNLAVNARDAMPDGGTLRISADGETVVNGHRSGVGPGRYVHLSVADTGAGMDQATLKRAIEPFFSTKGIGKGTGLGLSMVHGLASQLGGALTITSSPGLGTNVELWLPVSAAPPMAGERPAVEAPKFDAVGTVLLVDDEEVVRMSTADMLTDLGYTVVEADSAEDALTLVNGGLRPDLLVTDHLMPGMSGTELARQARCRQPGLPVLVVSGYAEVEGIDPSLPRLTKPYRQSELATALTELAAGQGSCTKRC